MKSKFYICKHCGNLIEKIHDAGVPMICCGEKHLPVAVVEGGKVKVNVGSVDHPMIPEHFIQWVYLQTEQGSQLKYLRPDQEPNVSFQLGEDKAVAVYAYCNLHGLWMVEL